MLRSTSSIDFPWVDTNAPTKLDLFFRNFSHCEKKIVLYILLIIQMKTLRTKFLTRLVHTFIMVYFDIGFKETEFFQSHFRV